MLKLATIHRTEVGILGIATIYSFIIPLRGGITLFDAAFLISLFGVYVYLASRGEVEEESTLVGPAETIANLPTRTAPHRAAVACSLYAGGAILVAAEPFAEGLIETGTQLGIDEFQLVQWVAPFASEFPEFLVAGLLAWRLRADAALGALVSSKVNQWTLLIGCLPIAYAISSGTLNPLPTDDRQAEEVLLTAAQSLLAVVLLINLRMTLWEGGLLCGPVHCAVPHAALASCRASVFTVMYHRRWQSVPRAPGLRTASVRAVAAASSRARRLDRRRSCGRNVLPRRRADRRWLRREATMATYVVLANLTDQGVRTMQDLSRRLENARGDVQSAGRGAEADVLRDGRVRLRRHRRSAGRRDDDARRAGGEQPGQRAHELVPRVHRARSAQARRGRH